MESGRVGVVLHVSKDPGIGNLLISVRVGAVLEGVGVRGEVGVGLVTVCGQQLG